MQIPLPRVLIRGWTAFSNWGNVTVWKRGRIEVVRLDLVLVALGIFVAAFYGSFGGWGYAMKGLGMYVAVMIMGLLFRPK